MPIDETPTCPACGKPLAEHLGLIGTCAAHREARAVADAAEAYLDAVESGNARGVTRGEFAEFSAAVRCWKRFKKCGG